MNTRTLPAIPNVPRPGQDRYEFDRALKEAIETIMGRRAPAIKHLVPVGERWKDLLAEITTRTTGAGTPVYNTFVAPNRSYQFAVNDEVYNTMHIPHDWKFGTPLYIHVHWMGSNTDIGTVTWDFNYTYAPGYGKAGFSANQLIQVTQAHCGIVNGHNIAELSELQAFIPQDCEPDGLLKVATKLSAKTFTGNVFADYIDLHYQSDENMTTSRNPVNGAWIKNDSEHSGELLAAFNALLDRLQG